MAIPPIAALEIGSTRTVVCVGEGEKKGDRVRIIGYGIHPTAGVHKGQITDLEKARESVRGALDRVSKMLPNVDIRQAMLVVSGSHIQSQSNAGVLSIQAANRVVSRKDVEEVNENADNVPISSDREVLHLISQNYVRDDQPGVADPEGMTCSVLTCNKLAIHGLKNCIGNALNVAKGENLEVAGVVFAGCCAAKSVLSPAQKQRGVLLVDLGGGTTSYMAYVNGVLAKAGCIAVGAAHVTKDIEAAFCRHNLTPSRAEKLKCEHGCATLDSEGESPRIILPRGITELDDLQINRHSLNLVINARMNELFSVLRDRMDKAGLLPDLRAVVLTGGGAYLRKITGLASHVLGMPCTIGTPKNVDGLEQEKQAVMFAAVAGGVIYGHSGYKETGFIKRVIHFFKSSDSLQEQGVTHE